jgi:hypothetical protein
MVNIYCLKCREKREVVDAQETTMKNGTAAIRGTCPECGTNVFRTGKLKEGESL